MASIPVLGYHRIGTPDPENLALTVADFDRQCQYIRNTGYRTITLGELHDHLRKTRICTGRCVVLTFDDGTRDVLLNALPVLQKYGLKATVFAIADRTSDEPRAAFDAALDFNASHARAWAGDYRQFLTMTEVRQLTATGLIEVHAHSARHDQVFSEPAVTAIYPDTDQHWGVVSAYGGGALTGRWPVFKRGPALTHRRLVADTAAIAATMREAVGERAEDLVKRINRHGVPVAWLTAESTAEQQRRVRDDLTRARALFADTHDPRVEAMCWPWGARNADLEQIARDVGFTMGLRTSAGANAPGDDPMAVHRLPVRRASVARLAIGLWLRRIPWLARLYGQVHRRV